jgi:hypothetical protein
MGVAEIGVLSLFVGLPAIILGFILCMNHLKNKRLEIEKEMQNNKIKLLDEENKKLDKIIKIRENNMNIEM